MKHNFSEKKARKPLVSLQKNDPRSFWIWNHVIAGPKRSGAEHALNYRKDPEILVSLETSRENNYDNQVSFAANSISGDLAEENSKKDTNNAKILAFASKV